MTKPFLAAALALLASILSFSSGARAADPASSGTPGRPLRIGWVQAMANAPALIADKKGFYAAEGLAVELMPFGDGPVIQQAVAANEVDAAYIGAPPVYQWFSRGLDVRILAKVNSGQAAVISNNPEITSLAALKGRRLAGVTRGSGMDVLLRGYVLKEAAHLDPDSSLELVQMQVANMNAALDRHAIDAAFSWEPFISQQVLRGGGRVVFDLNQALPSYPWYVIAVPAKTLQARPDDVIKLLRAHAKAIAFLNEHPAEANAIIAEAFKLEPVTAPDGHAVPPAAIVAEARKRLGWSDTLTDQDIAFIQRLADYSLAQGYLAHPLDIHQVVDLSWSRKTGR